MPGDDRRDDEDDNDRPRRRRREEDDYLDDDRPRRRRRREDDDDDYDRRPAPGVDPVGFIVPKDVSALSILSCYLGLIGCVIPLIGLLFALIALPCGILALRRKKKQRADSYGKVTGDIRAVFGIVTSAMTILGHIIFLIAYVVTNK